MTRAIRWGAMVLLMLVLPLIAPATGSQAAQQADCAGLDAYVTELIAIGDKLEAAMPASMEDDLENWTSEQFTAASDAIDTAVLDFEAIEVPAIAETFHALMLEQMRTLSAMFDTMSTAGIFGAFIYVEQMDEVDQQMEAASVEIDTACGIDLYAEFEDAEPAATPLAGTSENEGDQDDRPANSIEVGTRANPIPMGETVQIDDDWELTVLSVEPDATDSILAADSFTDPPIAGRQFFMATVRVTYTGDSSDEFSGWNLRAVGQSAVSYGQFDDSCGWSIPNALTSRELFTGGTIEGNLCWSIDSVDADSLVLYNSDQESEDRVYLSLMPSADSETATPAAPVETRDQKSS